MRIQWRYRSKLNNSKNHVGLSLKIMTSIDWQAQFEDLLYLHKNKICKHDPFPLIAKANLQAPSECFHANTVIG